MVLRQVQELIKFLLVDREVIFTLASKDFEHEADPYMYMHANSCHIRYISEFISFSESPWTTVRNFAYVFNSPLLVPLNVMGCSPITPRS